ncbi:MAG: AmmeMemoRadiSam system protein B, partial [Kiritimatiellales bacterium]
MIREPAVAGMFYPADPAELRRMIEGFLAEAKPGAHPKAIVAPHAGYIYSGPIAASVYKRINPENILRVVLIGPSHRVALRGLAASSAPAWRTPLGEVSVARPNFVQISDAAHAQEHSLEVQVPFLQTVLGDFTLL